MISFDTESHRFNLRAAAVIFHDEHVLLHQVEGDDFWCLPGGRVEPGENAAQTVIREMQEEIGTSVRIEKTLFIAENFFSHNRRPHHEIGFYFLASLEGHSALLDLTVPHEGVEGSKRLIFSWVPRRALTEIDLRPIFLRRLLQGDQEAVAHVVQRDSYYEISY